ncbi:MAG TPA: addiction module protein [Pirellulaceae bacterium]|nr:addiction module protein [Pirellulaceae bacterium]
MNSTMIPVTAMDELLSLSAPQKLALIGALWDSIEAEGQPVPVSDALVAELDRRKANAAKNPDSLVPLEAILKRLGRTDGA